MLYYLYYNGLNYLLLEPDTVEQFTKFSAIDQIETRPLKIILTKPDKGIQIPFPIFNDPFVSIDIDVICEESNDYRFELFKFYQYINEKVKN